MKKIIAIIAIVLLLVLFGFFMSGCKADQVEGVNGFTIGDRAFKEIAATRTCLENGVHTSVYIYYDTKTRVEYMFFVGNGTSALTPLFNADGTLITYDGK